MGSLNAWLNQTIIVNLCLQVETMEKKKERLLTIKFNADTAAQMRWYCKIYMKSNIVQHKLIDQ